MNIDNNFYQNADYRYTEIGIALEDFTYGGTVKVSIPTITPFMNNENEVENTEVASSANIINADMNALGINSYESKKISTSNNMVLKVPYYLADVERSPIEHPFVGHGQGHPAVKHIDFIRVLWDGTKGTRFIISFVGGELSNARIVGRMD